MDKLEFEQNSSDIALLKIRKHYAVIKRYIFVIPLMAIIGLLIGVGIQRIAKDKFVEEVLIKQGDKLHLATLKYYLQPTKVYFFRNDFDDKNGNDGSAKLPPGSSGAAPDTNYVVINNQSAVQLDLGQLEFQFEATELGVLERIASGRNARIEAIMNLDLSSPLRMSATQDLSKLEDALAKFNVFKLSKKSEYFLISFEGSSFGEATSVIGNLIDILNANYVNLEKQRISAALSVKIEILDTQINARKDFLQKLQDSSSGTSEGMRTNDAMSSDPILIALVSDRKSIGNFSIKDREIKPFRTIPTKRYKKYRLTGTNFWLVMTTISGLLLGFIFCYLLDKIRTLRQRQIG